MRMLMRGLMTKQLLIHSTDFTVLFPCSWLREATDKYKCEINLTLSLVRKHFILAYQDMIPIFSTASVWLTEHVLKILSLIKSAVMTLKRDKWRFHTETINYLQHVLHPRRLELASRTSEGNCGLQACTGFYKTFFFLGLCKVYRRFVFLFGERAAAMIKDLLKSQREISVPPIGKAFTKWMNWRQLCRCHPLYHYHTELVIRTWCLVQTPVITALTPVLVPSK